MKPLIGLTSYREHAVWGVWAQGADLLPSVYADAIIRAGGVPVLLPPASDDPDAAAALVERLDGLVISGGADVDPAQYGEERQRAHRRGPARSGRLGAGAARPRPRRPTCPPWESAVGCR